MATQEKKYLTCTFNFKEKDDSSDDGYFRFEGYASTFNNVDLGDDVVMPGAFKESLKSGRKLKLLYQHDMHTPLGVYDDVYEDEKGLFVRGKMPKDNSMVKDVMSLMKCGAIDSMSIGYYVVDSEYKDGKRLLKELDVVEASLVTMPMNPKATITGMKYDIEAIKQIKTQRDFEQYLRDSGLFSKQAAVALAAHFVPERESQEQEVKKRIEQELCEMLKNFKLN